MNCTRIRKNEIGEWNEKLKLTDASFFQYPYYASGYKHFFLSKAVHLKFSDSAGQEHAFCTILQIGIWPFKIGLIIRGPVILNNNISASHILESLKLFAKKNRYLFLRINPDNQSIEQILKADIQFQQKDYFPSYKGSQSKDFIVNHTCEQNLVPGFRRDCRQKIKFADELEFVYSTAKTEADLQEVYELFESLGKDKNFKYRPYNSYKEIFVNGLKHDLCSVYTVKLNLRLVCAAFVVKDAGSYNYFSGALSLRDIKPKNSPSNKLQYLIMKDCFYEENKPRYNLSYSSPGSGVHMFKDSFHPKVQEKPGFYTYVINEKVAGIVKLLHKNRLKPIRTFFRHITKTFK